jgi:ectoine hydroxylase-related dioxygenase (phytanoyl-CoA dioxygenase family)
VPRTHDNGYSAYEPVDPAKNVFSSEITPSQRRDALAVPCELQPNFASLHDGKLIHGSPANNSQQRRCGYTMRYMPSHVKMNGDNGNFPHLIYMARGKDLANNDYADPGKSYAELARYREKSGKKFH